MAKKDLWSSIVFYGIALAGAIVEVKMNRVKRDTQRQQFNDFMKQTDEFVKNHEIKINVKNTSSSTDKLVEYLKRKKAEHHIMKMVNEACAMDDGLSEEEKSEKVKEAASRMGYDVGD